MNGGILPSGLFWTVSLRGGAFRVSDDRRHAVLNVNGLSAIDTFQIFGPNDTPATLDFSIEWDTRGRSAARGSGDEVAPTDPAAFSGTFRRAKAEARFSVSEIGFGFESKGPATAKLGFAELGSERNGAFLT